MSSFTKNTKNQLLVQYETMQQAGVALSYLNGRTLNYFSPDKTPGSCRLEIVPSFLKVLTFKKLDSRNRDYSSLNEQVRAVFPTSVAIKASQQGWLTRDFLWGQHIKGEGWLDPVQDPEQMGAIPLQSSANNNKEGLPIGKVGDCVKLSGLPDESVLNAEGLFRVASMYGEVVSAKLMAKRKGCALVQFTDKEYAERAVEKLNEVKVFGEKWEAVISKHANALHWDGAGTELQTRMCTATRMTRPEVPGKDVAGRPSHYVGVQGIPEGVDAEMVLRDAMAGFNPADVSAAMDHQALAGFDTKEAAFRAVMQMNGAVTPEGYILSLYFIESQNDDDDDYATEVEETDDWNDSFSSASDFRIKTEGYCLRRGSLSSESAEEVVGRQKTL
eukprot:TRINITY_DN6348_c0_g1_i1.p1 TRINITY_DN6348_c0_g1~~TRINITY_DN6348_c0_g1_i1.p1  ORF type:complete len:455 (+),score=153.25 TRINITY_DN6348_c0_g1_i1:206-1366(+)